MNQAVTKEKYKINFYVILSYIFLFTCCIPFLFPNRFIVTNIQPYACVIGLFLLFLCIRRKFVLKKDYFIVSFFTFLMSLFLIYKNGFNVNAYRAIFNYFSVFVIPLATLAALSIIDHFPEKFFKFVILMWLFVSFAQFFFYRGFLTNLIGGVRWSLSYRGVVGLASEPSFLGIVSFYFLHLITYFKSKRILYLVLTLIMGVVFAQSAMGVLFILGYIIVFVFEKISSKKGIYVFAFSLLLFALFVYIINTKMVGTRLYYVYKSITSFESNTLMSDESIFARVNSIKNALLSFYYHNFLPQGFTSRIGSGFGGFLVELGFFAIPIICLICKYLSKTFTKKRSIILYFIIVLCLLFNNTQIGNPILLMLIGINIMNEGEKQYEKTD